MSNNFFGKLPLYNEPLKFAVQGGKKSLSIHLHLANVDESYTSDLMKIHVKNILLLTKDHNLIVLLKNGKKVS